jgi:Mg2+/Co2+ transporter CorB
MILSIFIILFLICCSAICSAAETAFTTVDRGKIIKLEDDGNSSAAVVHKLLNNKKNFIIAILTVNTVVNIICSSIATKLFINFFMEEYIIYFALFMSIVVLIFAEVLPKTFAIANPSKIALVTSWPVYGLLFILGPPINFFRKINKKIALIFNIKIKNESISLNEAIHGLIAFYEKNDDKRYDIAILKSIIDIDEMTIENVMIKRSDIFSININDSIVKIRNKIFKTQYRNIVVFNNNIKNEVIGVISIYNLIKTIYYINNFTKDDLMSLIEKPLYVKKTVLLKEQLNKFCTSNKYIALVIDDDDILQGIVTVKDILSEMIGEIKKVKN